MRKMLAALLAGGMLLAGAAVASADTIPPEWGLINPTSIDVAPSYDLQNDFGYYIWTEDAGRRIWDIRWVDGPNSSANNPTFFSGNIVLKNNIGSFSTITFEDKDTNVVSTDSLGDQFFTWIQKDEDGLRFEISQTGAPSYVGFDLSYDSKPMDANYIYVGPQTVASLGQDHDFQVPAPVPEPGTMMLLGAGFLGLAIYGKRRKNA